MPDGLEWSYRERPDQPGFKPVITNENTTIEAVDQLQSKYTPLPDYTLRGASAETSKGWTSFAGVSGSLLTMLAVWAGMSLMRRKEAKAMSGS
jgi:hypothetical protein